MPDDEKQAHDHGSEPGDEPRDGEGDQAALAKADAFRPEAIAERVGTIGEETELDRIAREEEARLTERKKTKKGKGALESAASKRLARIGEGKVKRPSAAARGATAVDADPLLERTMRLGEWLKQHQQAVGALVVVAALGAAGALGWTYWEGKRDAEASALLAAGFADEHGTIAATKDDDDEDEGKPAALYPVFPSVAARRDAALAQYRKVESKFGGTGAAILARLAEAGLLLDQGDARGALGAYDDVQRSPLAAADAQVRGRALEGVGFAHELLAAAQGPGASKDLDDALSAYRELERIDLKGFKELGKYHQARVLQAKGDKAKAVELLKDVVKAVTEPGETHPFPYLQAVAEDRLRDLDPSALPPKPKPGELGIGPGSNPDDPRVQELIRQFQEQMKNGGGGGNVPLPGGPK